MRVGEVSANERGTTLVVPPLATRQTTSHLSEATANKPNTKYGRRWYGNSQTEPDGHQPVT
jgi:hypothetical protein